MIDSIRWERFPRLAGVTTIREWLSFCEKRGLASNTVEAYGRALDDFLFFCSESQVDPGTATRHDVAAYIANLRCRPQKRGARVVSLDAGSGLSNATLHQRLTGVRLYFDYLIEEGFRASNPVARGRYTPGRVFAPSGERGLIPRFRKLPWIPNGDQWKAILEVAKTESLRTRTMFALGYDGALRREELCSIHIGDIDPAHRLLRIRAETTKNRRARVVAYSNATAGLYAAYIHHRHALCRESGALFLSESRRNPGKPLSIWTWSKTVASIAKRSAVLAFTTHSLRHLCLTDLASAGWDVHEIATFAGHASLQSTLLYIHLSGRELATKVEKGMAQIHAWRTGSLVG